MPSCSAARISNVPLGTVTSLPSMASVTRSPSVTGSPPSLQHLRQARTRAGDRGLPFRRDLRAGLAGRDRRYRGPLLERAPPQPHVLLVLVAEVLQRRLDRRDRPVGQRAERLEQ